MNETDEEKSEKGKTEMKSVSRNEDSKIKMNHWRKKGEKKTWRNMPKNEWRKTNKNKIDNWKQKGKASRRIF